MFQKKTLIVVGAGASKEGKLPDGTELKKKNSNILDLGWNDEGSFYGDHLFLQVLEECRRQFGNTNAVQLAKKIREAMPLALSIDNFLDAHQGNLNLELCGKLAIVRAILMAERNSLLYIDLNSSNGSLDFQSLDRTWFIAFMQLLTENCKVDQLEDRLSSICFIVFNYDRCIEHFLFHAFQAYYEVNSIEAAKLVSKIEIFHPYGTLGTLPWAWEQCGPVIDFGAEPGVENLIALAREIKTFTEGTDPDSSDISMIRDRVFESQIVLFLGFAFHRINLDLLRPGRNHSENKLVRYYCTGLGISDSDRDAIKIELGELAGVKQGHIILRNDLTCAALFREYWRSLSLS